MSPRAGTPVIDLGEDWEPRAEAAVRPRLASRRAPLILAGLLLLVVLGGAAPPRYTMVGLFGVPIDVGSAQAISGDTLYLSRAGEVAAYALPTGTRKWSFPVPRGVGVLLPVPAAGVLLAQFGDQDFNPGAFALDTRTGRLLWRDSQARVLGALPGSGRALLLRLDEVQGIDVPTGRTIWERPRGLGVAWTLPDIDPAQNAPPRLAFDDGAGVTEVVDVASGRIVSRAALEEGWPPAPGGPPVLTTPTGFVLTARTVVGGQLFVARQQDTDIGLDAYDVGTLARLWRIRLAQPAYFVTDCGPLLCVDGFSSMYGVDRHTGAVRWTSTQWRQAQPLPGGRLLVSGAVADAPVSVVDATNLQPVRALAGWQPVPGPAGHALLAGRDGPALRTWFALVDAAGPRVRTLGSAVGVQLGQCETSDGYLACPTVHNDLRVWAWHA